VTIWFAVLIAILAALSGVLAAGKHLQFLLNGG
jgi:hypothetical protein